MTIFAWEFESDSSKLETIEFGRRPFLLTSLSKAQGLPVFYIVYLYRAKTIETA